MNLHIKKLWLQRKQQIRRLTLTQANACVEAYVQIPVKLINVDLKRSLALVKKFRMYAYDAYLLVCAMQMGTPLLTLDKPLKVAASSVGIEILEI